MLDSEIKWQGTVSQQRLTYHKGLVHSNLDHTSLNLHNCAISLNFNRSILLIMYKAWWEISSRYVEGRNGVVSVISGILCKVSDLTCVCVCKVFSLILKSKEFIHFWIIWKDYQSTLRYGLENLQDNQLATLFHASRITKMMLLR